ncbi:MAG: 4-(cytidine 5'-diphospho)-2-C-methyl-D-erythritol kinase [Candidatus Dormibacteraeota bacterium]|nr:4-(cytidine 5'-diphospho)-2-C-methyl-D-erythritol kinase [Candidatus Dormibacteraeota bacterium]
MTGELAIVAPAKLNLGLEVVGRRPDGLHELVSIMVNVDLADDVRITTQPGLELTGPYAGDAPADPGQELASRALRALQARSSTVPEHGLSIVKRIPVGAGLGGGSADAAAVLRAGSALGVDLAATDLLAIALELGADVPFQLQGGAALVRGVGEQLETLPVPELWAAVVFPGIAVSTAAVFAELKESEWGTGKMIEAAARFLADGGGAGALARLPNSLMAPALRLHPGLAEHVAALRQKGWDPHLTGTGSALYQVCFDRSEAESLAVRTWDMGLRAWAVRAIALPGGP